MNQSSISITIPCQHFLKKYLSKKVEVTPFQLTNKGCHISALFFEPIEKGFFPKKEVLANRFDDFIVLQLNTSFIKEGRFHLDNQVVHRIDRILHDKFEDELFHWLNRKMQEEAEIKGAIFDFCDYYDLTEDDIAYETLKKSYYRKRVPPKPIRKPTKEELRAQLTLWSVE